MRNEINLENLASLPTIEELLTADHGERGILSREEVDAKSRVWYYAEY